MEVTQFGLLCHPGPRQRRQPRPLTALPGETFGYPSDRVLLLVVASSGADGRTLGRSLRPLPLTLPPPHNEPSHETERSSALSLRWLPAGPRRLPRLCITYSSRLTDGVPQTLIYSAGGELEHTWSGVYGVDRADFDGDGLPDCTD
jgi:hypothetical protein